MISPEEVVERLCLVGAGATIAAYLEDVRERRRRAAERHRRRRPR